MALSNWTFGNGSEAQLDVLGSAGGYNDLIRSTNANGQVDMAVSGSDSYGSTKEAWKAKAVLHYPNGLSGDMRVQLIPAMSAGDLTDASTWDRLVFDVQSDGDYIYPEIRLNGTRVRDLGNALSPFEGATSGSNVDVSFEAWRPNPGELMVNYTIDAMQDGSPEFSGEEIFIDVESNGVSIDPSTYVAHGMRLGGNGSPYVAQVEYGWN